MPDSQANIAAAFLRNAHLRGDETFLKIRNARGSVVYSYRQIASLAMVANAHFRKCDLARGSVIAIILRHSVELYSSFFGALMAGLVPTIMPFPTPKQDKAAYWTSHAELFRLSGISAIYTYEENITDIDRWLGTTVTRVFTAADVDPGQSSDEISSNHLAVLQHSSGTTALKKGVMLTHEAIFNQVENYAKALSLEPGNRIASWLPLYHDMGFIACFLMPMIVGCPVVHIDPFVWSAKPTILLDEIDAFGGEYVWMPNFAFNHIANLARAGEWSLGTVKAIINCSEPCKPATFEKFRRIPQFRNLSDHALQVCYAMAENVFAVTQTDLAEQPRVIRVRSESLRQGRTVELATGDDAIEVLSCGMPISGTTVAVIDSQGVPQHADWMLGEIALTGKSMYAGYYKRDEITAQRLIDGWHHTGDIGFFVRGELFVTGRVDDLLVIRGKNFYAHEIEEAVNELDLVLPGRAVAIAAFDTASGDAALVILAEGADLSLEATIARAVRNMVIDRFGISLADFRLLPPQTLRKTTSGKLSRKDNLKLYKELERE